MVEKQEKMIKQSDWDILIILDACRYDYFEKVYGDYLNGELKKVISPATGTIDWVKKVFRGKYTDLVYVSANPLINSKIEMEDFDAKKHFHKVIDVWDWGWNEDWGVVHPEKVNKATLKAREFYSIERFVIHYLQPHAPYCLVEEKVKNKINFASMLEIIGLTLIKNPKWVGRWIIRGMMGRNPVMAREWAARRLGKDGLRLAYEENLKLVLDYVRRLLESLSGKIVITADHGELLGESGQYGHTLDCRHPLLVEVPWIEIERGKKGLEKSRVKRIIQKMKHEGRL